MDLQCKYSYIYFLKNKDKTSTILMTLYRFIISNIFNVSILYI